MAPGVTITNKIDNLSSAPLVEDWSGASSYLTSTIFYPIAPAPRGSLSDSESARWATADSSARIYYPDRTRSKSAPAYAACARTAASEEIATLNSVLRAVYVDHATTSNVHLSVVSSWDKGKRETGLDIKISGEHSPITVGLSGLGRAPGLLGQLATAVTRDHGTLVRGTLAEAMGSKLAERSGLGKSLLYGTGFVFLRGIRTVGAGAILPAYVRAPRAERTDVVLLDSDSKPIAIGSAVLFIP
ncbi:MAG: hypothetical protein ACREU2_05450 [Steroidobacteraceae bacterium]